ncbi:opacity family porin [Moraxella sp. FZLJ2107]|uniref:opacity family porin n=1 Tax=unclassified Moraxella TaxID=2685852 RepID=UPI0020C89AFE|nr:MULTISPECIES: opacity family porin [unclassified Moraxella]UTO04551.1 opacity family porin [Moraxella sp. FZLJ2107]UTO23384.1 opacity family porin [Moraxella sp. FZLJ2109]
MKKIVLATAIAALSTAASAQYYVQGDVGYSKLEAKADGVKTKDNATSYGIAVGTDTGNVRYQADYTNFGKIEEKGSEGTAGVVGYDEWEATLKAQSLGLSAIYDFQTVSGFTPYAGVRVGINQLKLDDNYSTYTIMPDGTYTTLSGNESFKKTQVGAGVLAGVQYAINPQLAVDAGVEYNYLGKVEDIKLNQYGAKVGLRYNF